MSVLDMRRRVLPGQALGGHMRRHRQPLVAKKESLDLKLPAPSEGEQCYSDGLSRLRQWLLVSKGPFFSLRRRWCIAITEQRKVPPYNCFKNFLRLFLQSNIGRKQEDEFTHLFPVLHLSGLERKTPGSQQTSERNNMCQATNKRKTGIILA
ncbi:hypothetical protein HPP92_028445 [Vanilla planifolia]|uniref:Uncharacterized protein n=1 Tax=Vanilla planifolia TaxID=51239 RepID=A0A835PAW9_VANPL|nr:hypothetical protein HPP92_028445 [Vanilla planifolia]